MKYLFFAKLLLLSTALLAQTGNFFLSHYSPVTERFDNVCFDMVQDGRGLIYFATNNGILEFDGKQWELTPGKGAVYSLLIDSSGTIYWSGSTGFGLIGRNGTGKDSLYYLSDKATDVFKAISVQDHVYFVNDDSVFVVENKTHNISSIGSSNLSGAFTGLIELFGNPYVTTEGGGIFGISNGKLEQTDLHLPPDIEIFSSANLDETYLLLTSNSRVFHCDKSMNLHEISLQDQAYADGGVVVNISWVNNHLIALGTLRGGVLFVNPTTGRTEEIVNYTTGLPDNEVFAIMRDNNQSIWVAHDYGFTRISPYLPFRSFSHYPGLQGNLLCAMTFKNNVYVGTSLGLFELVKEDIYDELVTFVDVEIKYPTTKSKKQTAPVVVETPAVEKQPEPEMKKRGFFRFLKRKKDDKKPESDSKVKEETKPSPGKNERETESVDAKPRPKYRQEKRVERVLRSSQYAFHRVKGVEAKVTQLIEFNGKLIAAGLGGVYEINELQSLPIISDPARFIFGYRSQGLLLSSTYEDELHALLPGKNGWEHSDLFNNLDDQINFIFEGVENELWLAALDKVYRIQVEEHEVKNIQTLLIANTTLDETVGITLNDQIVFTNSSGFYFFNRKENSISRIDSLSRPRSYFATGGSLWYRDTHRWNTLGSTSEQSNLQLLNLFHDLRFINSEINSDNLWLVSRDNELFKFYGEKVTLYEKGYPAFLKSISSGDKPVIINDRIEIDENGGRLSFTVVQPDYTGQEAIEYRYILRGLHQEWSDWSTTNNSLDFPYLPPAKYNLQVQSRNIFGNIGEMKSVTFEVLPPYWKRSWFYALEFFVFAGLVILSYRLSTRYRFISRLLMLITIILLIEFIQTVAGATFASKDSPVMDFFIQVGVALVILPVEGYLRNLMLRSIGSPDIHPILGAKPGERKA